MAKRTTITVADVRRMLQGQRALPRQEQQRAVPGTASGREVTTTPTAIPTTAASATVETVETVEQPRAAPFPGYDDMNITEVTQRLSGLPDTEREAVRAYETAGKKRRGVLEALE